jgi:hypothetical protein
MPLPYCGNFAPFMIARADGAWLETTDARRILDGGIWRGFHESSERR